MGGNPKAWIRSTAGRDLAVAIGVGIKTEAGIEGVGITAGGNGRDGAATASTSLLNSNLGIGADVEVGLRDVSIEVSTAVSIGICKDKEESIDGSR